jgi:hypothetical protein
VEYYWKKDDTTNPGNKKIGFIAQELMVEVPEVVHHTEDDRYLVKIKEVVAVAIEAIKEQDQKISELEERAERVLEKARSKGLLS